MLIHALQDVHRSPRAHDLFSFFMFQIAPSTKKLWGVDEGGSKDEGGVKGGGTLLHLGDHPTTMWRDSTWSTTSGTIQSNCRCVVRNRDFERCDRRKCLWSSSMIEWNNLYRLAKHKKNSRRGMSGYIRVCTRNTNSALLNCYKNIDDNFN